MSGPFGSSQFMYATGAAEEGQSLRFEDGDSAYRSWTPASAGNRKTWTWSGWVKRGNLSTTHPIFFAVVSDNVNRHIIGFLNDNKFVFYGIDSSVVHTDLRSDQLFRDASAWYHFVASVDTTQATASDRVKLYVNGQQITSFS